jgi:formamidopyrimidine-DNA glycosylase
MPELPEVETHRKYLESALFDSPITEVELLREKVLKTPLTSFRNALLGKRFIATRRIGKFLFLQLESEQWVLFHFGMTGYPEFYSDEETRPRHTRLAIHFQDGLKLAYVCMRMFGKVELLDSVEDYRKENKLGVDAMDVKETAFMDYLKDRKQAVKSILLHQQAFAGIGNWIADEILFQAEISPFLPPEKLKLKQLQLLYKTMKNILEIAVDKEADYKKFPDHFMVKRRWGNKKCPHCEKPLSVRKIGGRGTYYCETKQHAH